MKTVFDFGDGRGEVPAHQHPNGMGWVENTAHVSDNARVYGNAMVFGDAHVSGNARVYGDAWAESPPYAQIGRWSAYMTSLKTIRIGCQEHPIASWNRGLIAELAKANNATKLELAGAISFIIWCKEITK